MNESPNSTVVQYGILAAGLIALTVLIVVRMDIFAVGPPPAEALHAQALIGGSGKARTEAAVALSRHPEATPAMLREVAQLKTLPAARAAAIAGLGKRRDVDSLPLLIDALEDESVLVRGRAGVAVERIVGLGMGFDPSGAAHERQVVIARYRKFWDDCQKPGSKFLEYMRNPEAVAKSAPPPRNKTSRDEGR